MAGRLVNPGFVGEVSDSEKGAGSAVGDLDYCWGVCGEICVYDGAVWAARLRLMLLLLMVCNPKGTDHTYLAAFCIETNDWIYKAPQDICLCERNKQEVGKSSYEIERVISVDIEFKPKIK